MDEGQGSTILSENRSTRASSATLANNAHSSLSPLRFRCRMKTDLGIDLSRDGTRFSLVRGFPRYDRITFLIGDIYYSYVFAFLLNFCRWMMEIEKSWIRKRFEIDFFLFKFLKIDESFSSSFFLKHSFTIYLSWKGIEVE